MPSSYKKGYSDKKAIEYIKNNYDQFSLRVPKGDREKYKKLAEEQGKSLNQLIVELLDAEKEAILEEKQVGRVLAYAKLLNESGLAKKVIDGIFDVARKNNIKKILLFGSRARGDYGRASDIDLAASGEDIVGFKQDLEEKVPTLLTFDVVDLNTNLSTDFRKTIENEGKLIYFNGTGDINMEKGYDENKASVNNVEFIHKTFEERLAEYGGEISICDFDWGEPVGRELL